MTPATGLLAFVVTTFFVLLLWNTLAVEPDRRQLLRSLLVVFGGAFVLKFVVLAAIYEPQGGLLRRVMLTMLEGVSLGTLGFVPDGAGDRISRLRDAGAVLRRAGDAAGTDRDGTRPTHDRAYV